MSKEEILSRINKLEKSICSLYKIINQKLFCDSIYIICEICFEQISTSSSNKCRKCDIIICNECSCRDMSGDLCQKCYDEYYNGS